MSQLSDLDFPDRLSPALPVWAGQVIWALICTIAPVLVRLVVDFAAPAAGPFSLVYPAVMVATLFGRWQAGLMTLVASILYAWYAVLPFPNSFAFEVPADGARTIVNFLAMLAILILSEIFRRAVRYAVEERDRQIENRELLLAEFNHRVHNNFSTVTSLLQMQILRADDEDTRDSLMTAIGRVESIARANRFLFSSNEAIDRIFLPDYLKELCNALRVALFEDRDIALEYKSDRLTISSDKAVTLGLVVNELVTNAAKHAFPDERQGRIMVSIDQDDDALLLSINDNGVGISGEQRAGSLGHRLMDALVGQLDGQLDTESDSQGTRISLRLAA